MTVNSGVKGKTVLQLQRSADAAERQLLRNVTTTDEQLAILATRPGMAAREIVRLFAGGAA